MARKKKTLIKFIQHDRYKIAKSSLDTFEKEIRVYRSALENFVLKPPTFDHDEWRCSACGGLVDVEHGRWQFCPICGQRFRDTWCESTARDNESE